jgi:hypothetical protein
MDDDERKQLDEAIARNREELAARRQYNSYSFEDAPTRTVEKSFETDTPPERTFRESSWQGWQDWGAAVAERVVEARVTRERELIIESVADALAEVEKGFRDEIAALKTKIENLSVELEVMRSIRSSSGRVVTITPTGDAA